ncbi:porin family protein [Sphingomicrobium flavum]|uniref:porin family protein n=1 Tax=Sphingomicrobium flavum TaxID=1229164 RepID=UPI0021AD699B|nr:porin family protein [Sphingomicrobium flavum]
MKTILSAAALATALIATPAAAQEANPFEGARIGANIGFADDDLFGTNEFTYGVEVGYDFAGNDKLVLGVTGEFQKSDDIDRELALGGRIGARVGNNGLIYGTASYSNLEVLDIKLDGVRFGIGGEIALGDNAFAKIEQRYGNYELDVDLWQTVIGAGFRF